jgi:propanol-preferring alcohol dehydrogenase
VTEATDIPKTMRAMRLERPRPAGERPLALVEMPVPLPGPGEVLIAGHTCGVCHTDLHTVEGELEPHRSPVVPGHQIVGEVVALGEGADTAPAGGEPDGAPLRLGERVGVPWLWRACGTCRYCRRGDENLCENALFTGYDVDGGYAEYTVAPAAFVYRLPDMPDLDVAPLLCAGIIGYRCLRLTGVVSGAALPGGGAAGRSGAEAAGAGAGKAARGAGRRLGLYGFGAAAHICLQVAVHHGWEVYVFTRGEEHRALARELGAVWAGAAGEEPGGAAAGGGAIASDAAAPAAAGARLDAAIVFAPAGQLALDALRACDKGGVVALGGIYSSPIPPIDYPVIYDERVLRSVANSTRQDARELLRVAGEIPIKTEVEPFDLEEANEALLALKEGRIRGAAVLRIR